MKWMGYFLFFFWICTAFADEAKPYRVYIKPGAILKKISDKHSYALPRGIYAFVLDRDYSRQENLFVYDKKGNPLYEVDGNDIVEIESDIALFPTSKADIRYPIPSTFKASNKQFYFDTQFNVHFDQISTSKLSELNDQNINSAIGNRFEIKTKLLTLFPVDFGITVNFESSTWSSEIEDVSLAIFSFGPYIQKSLYEEDNFSFFLNIGAELAPIYETKSTNYKDKFQGVLLDLGADGLWDTQYGKWSLGVHYRHHDLTLLNGENKNTPLVPENFAISTIGLIIGYKYEWKL